MIFEIEIEFEVEVEVEVEMLFTTPKQSSQNAAHLLDT